MLKILFDKGLETECSLDLDRISEHPVVRNLYGNRSLVIQNERDFPDISDFIGRETFTTVEITDSDLTPIPICNGYNRISDLATSYNDSQKLFTLSITIECAESQQN